MKHVFLTFLAVSFALNLMADDITLDRIDWVATDCGDETWDLLNLMDGNTGTEWRAAPQKAGQWLVVDMQSPQTFNQIMLDQTDSWGDYPRSIAVFVSNDGNDWGNAVFVGGGSDAAATIINLEDQTAQYIKFEVLTNCEMWWKIKELNVRLIDDKILWKQWTAATIYQNGITWNETKNMFDGNPDSRWNTSKQRPGQWVIVDMKEAQTFNQIQLFQNGGDYPRGYEVYVSEDASDWGDAIAVGAGRDFGGTDPFTFINLADTQQKRFVKVVQTFDSGDNDMYWSINEFSVNLVTPGDYRFGWTLSVFQQAGDGDAAFQALDNNPDSRWGSGTVQAPGQWIILDMKKMQSFNKIILNQPAGDYPRGYSIYLSGDRLANDDTNWGEAVYTGAQSSDIAELTIDLGEVKSARCIKIEQTGISGGWWCINEIHVSNVVTGLHLVSIDGPIKAIHYYNLQGVEIPVETGHAPSLHNGVFIQKTIYESGAVSVSKIIGK
ncbi:hypothetical protein FACS189413_11180 [Bacteroidia bacterium]|nr:hypothetical protein FACS189413_11180 [Bacteroidia bacterium]